jgi:hypothetical protein
MNAEFEGQTEAINGLGSGIWLRANISIKVMRVSDIQKLNFTCFSTATVISIIVLAHVTLCRRYCPFLYISLLFKEQLFPTKNFS